MESTQNQRHLLPNETNKSKDQENGVILQDSVPKMGEKMEDDWKIVPNLSLNLIWLINSLE